MSRASAAPPASKAFAGDGRRTAADKADASRPNPRAIEFNQAVDAAGTARHPPVLRSFTVEETDGALRVIDSDGSVYSGSFAAMGPAAGHTPATDRPLKDACAEAPARPFLVAGTNRTLNLPVRLTGVLTAAGSAGRARHAAPAAAAEAAPVTPLPPALRIQGQALLAGTNAWQIEALSVQPSDRE